MKGLCVGVITISVLFAAACKASEPPTQVVYRFDDHRYLELKGWDCEGELWYTDTQRAIHSQVYLQFYRIFTRKFIHPSEKYMSIPIWGLMDLGFRRIMVEHGNLHNLHQGKMNLTAIITRLMRTFFLSLSSTIRDFYRLNTGCICHPNHLKILVY